MVVVSGSWVKNVVSFPTNGDLITPKMAARAVLICRPNSHPFQERALLLDQPVKIGRSVARARAVPNNAIFDCKVLSRNHALLWYEKGKFYVQDTKSSNGTFVNNQRLSKGAEESPPREVCSGDLVQFGVDVMENARKVTHGCIVATLKLYLPDGKEAKASPYTSVVSSVGAVSLEDLYQLNQYLQEALQREQMLENKLVSLQNLVETTRQASELGWKALIDEDRLLSRVEILESQLQVSSKNFAEDKLREELRKLQEDKCQYQGTAKESLQKVLQEKLEAIQKLQALELNVSNTENECAHLKKLCERSQLDLQELAAKYSQQLQKVEDLTSKLQDSDEQNRETCERLEQEKRELQCRMEEQIESERALQVRLDALEADGDITQQKMVALQSHLNLIGKNEDNDGDTKIQLDNMKGTDSTGTQVDIILERIDPDAEMRDDNTTEELEGLRHQLKKYEDELQESAAKLTHLQGQLDTLRGEEEASSERNIELQERIDDIEMELALIQSENENNKNNETLTAQNNATQATLQINTTQSPNLVNKLKLELSECQELLAASRAKKRASEVQKGQYQHELDCANAKLRKTNDDAALVKHQLQLAQCQVNAKNETVVELERLLVDSAEEVKAQLGAMQEKVNAEWERANWHASEAQQLKEQLVDAQQEAKQCHNESEQTRDRLKAVQEELEVTRRSLKMYATASQDNRQSEELVQLREHCCALEQKNKRLEASTALLSEQIQACNQQSEQLREIRAHNSALLQRLSLQAATTAASADVPAAVDLADQLAAAQLAAVKLVADQLAADQLAAVELDEYVPHIDVAALEEELVVVKEEFTRCNEDKTQLANELKQLREEIGALANTSYAVPVHYLIAMALAVVAILVSYCYII